MPPTIPDDVSHLVAVMFGEWSSSHRMTRPCVEPDLVFWFGVYIEEKLSISSLRQQSLANLGLWLTHPVSERIPRSNLRVTQRERIYLQQRCIWRICNICSDSTRLEDPALAPLDYFCLLEGGACETHSITRFT
jgi:hypothetical protein